MPAELVTDLLQICSGSLFLGLFVLTIWQIWRFGRPAGPLDRGACLRTEALNPQWLDALREVESGTSQHPWGWTRREGEHLVVYVDPYYAGDGDLRLQTFWRYAAELRLDEDAPEVRFRSPLLPLVVLGPLFLVVVPYINHRVLVDRVRRRLERLAGPAAAATGPAAPL